MDNLLILQAILQKEAKELLNTTALLSLLGTLGTPIQTGSSVTGLMVYPDIDFTVHNDSPCLQDAIDIVPLFFEKLAASRIEIVDFSMTDKQTASYYVGFEFTFNNKAWHIDATIAHTGKVVTNPPELASWIDAMDDEQRLYILRLKKELVDTKRYAGARSQPPYTFRSSHLYEAVLKGGARTIAEVELYFSK